MGWQDNARNNAAEKVEKVAFRKYHKITVLRLLWEWAIYSRHHSLLNLVTIVLFIASATIRRLCIPYAFTAKQHCALFLWPFINVRSLLVCHSYLFFYTSTGSRDQCWVGLFAEDLGGCSRTAFWVLPRMPDIRNGIDSGRDWNKVGFCCWKTRVTKLKKSTHLSH